MKITGYVGIDPGLTGAVAHLDLDYRVVRIDRIPNRPKKGNAAVRHEIDEVGLLEVLDRCEGKHCFIEDPGVIPTNGPFRVASQHGTLGLIKGMLRAIGAGFTLVPSQRWKKQYSLSSNKTKSIELAVHLNPEIARMMLQPGKNRILKEDADMAEAVLIGRYGMRYVFGVTERGKESEF